MRKKLLLSALLCCSMLTTLSATTVTIDDFIIEGATPNAYLDNSTDPEHQNSVCMGTGDTLIVSIDDKFFYDGGLIYYSWATAGSVAIADTISNNSVRVVSNGYGKGRVYFRYRTGDCSTFMAFDIFKSFSAKDFNISGPDCMTPGDVVVLSVLPVLTEHLSHQIGIDRYYWNVTATPKPAFVDRIIYAAGDGSAVTFVAGNVSDSDYVSVNFGVCNQASDRAARRKLGKTAPKPDVPDEVCAVYGLQTITLSVNEPVDGVEYLWWCKNAKWQFDQTVGTSVSVTLDAESSEDIVVTASYVDGSGCSGTETSIKVNRSWGTDVALTSPSSTSYQFATGSTYEFRLTGQLSSGSIEWLCPQGWSIAPTSSQGYVNIKLIPGANALLQDTLRARTHSCSESGYDVVEHVVYVHPAPVTAISGETCLTAGQQYVFRVAAEGNGPKAASYTWKINNNTASYAAFTGDSILFTATEGMTSISVRPNGLNGCNGNFYTQNLLFKPVTPTGIVAAHCIAAGVSDTVTLSIEGAQPNQNYEWELPNDITYVSGNNSKSTIVVKTNGIAGNSTVQAHAVSSCGSTNPVSLILHTGDVLFSLDIVSRRTNTMVYTYPEILEDTITESPIAYYEWYLNDELISQGPAQYDVTLNTANAVGTIRLVVTLENGCKQSAMASFDNALRAPKSNREAETITQDIEELHIAPNPAQNTIRVDFPSQADKTIVRIYGISGQHVSRFVTTDTYTDIDTSSFPNGIYTIVISQDGVRCSADFIVQH